MGLRAMTTGYRAAIALHTPLLEPLPPKARRGPHLRAEGVGKLMTLLVTAGQRHEQPQFVPLMEHGAVA
jgi:hypothetical protein